MTNGIGYTSVTEVNGEEKYEECCKACNGVMFDHMFNDDNDTEDKREQLSVYYRHG